LSRAIIVLFIVVSCNLLKALGALQRSVCYHLTMRIQHRDPLSQQETDDFIEDIICNNCGRSLKDAPHLRWGLSPSTRLLNFEGLVEVQIVGGYAAQLGDMTRYIFSLCESCLLTMFQGFKHPPQVDDIDFDGTVMNNKNGT
jgi:hypothetical protein